MMILARNSETHGTAWSFDLHFPHKPSFAMHDWQPPKPPAPYTLDALICPITHMMIRKPVLASDGAHYDLEALQSWIRMGAGHSPKTREPLTGKVEDLALQSVVSSLLVSWKASFDAWLSEIDLSCPSADKCLQRAFDSASDVLTVTELACMLVKRCPQPSTIPSVSALLREAGWFCRRCGEKMSVLHEHSVDVCAQCVVTGGSAAKRNLEHASSHKWFFHFDTAAQQWSACVQQKSIILRGPWEGVDEACRTIFLEPTVPIHLVCLPGVMPDADVDLVRAFSKATHGQFSIYSGTRLLAGPRRVLPEHIVSINADAA